MSSLFSMQPRNPELFAKIREQFDSAPYPRIALESFPENLQELYLHNLVTSYYLRNKRVISSEGKLILDAGCGSGYKSLVLAIANPGAKIVGIDLSEPSVDLARKRLDYQGIEGAEFHVLAIEEVGQLGYQFDYINLDDVLYLFEDIGECLGGLKSVLKPEGIIRANLHSALQRKPFFRAQEVFKMMGLMEGNPEEFEIEITRETMRSLKNNVNLKQVTWDRDLQTDPSSVLMNYLFQGDKGYTITDLFAALRTANLDFISLCNWRHWDWQDLFKDVEAFPEFLEKKLAKISVEDRLRLFELIHPVHRLINFWCGHFLEDQSVVSLSQWSDQDWQNGMVYLHPQLQGEKIKRELEECIQEFRPFRISRWIPVATFIPVEIDSHRASCLLPLWEGKQPIRGIVERWLKMNPVDPITLKPLSLGVAWEQVIALITSLERCLYLLVER